MGSLYEPAGRYNKYMKTKIIVIVLVMVVSYHATSAEGNLAILTQQQTQGAV